MDILGILIAQTTTLAGVLLLVLGLWTYFEHRERPVRQTFAALLIAAALWVLTFVLWNAATDARQELFWLKTLFSIGSLLPPLFLLFILAFIGRFPRTAVQALILLPSAALFVIAYGSALLVTGTDAPPFYAIGAAGQAVFAWHFSLMLVAALLAVLYEQRVNPAFDRAKTVPLVIGAIVAFHIIFILLFVARIGEGSVTRQWIGNLAVMALVAGMLTMAYVVDSKKFLGDLRPVGGEMLILVAIFLVSMDIAVAPSSIGLSVRMVILILLVIYGVSAVKTASREIRRLREIGMLHDQLVKVNGRLIEAEARLRATGSMTDPPELFRTETDVAKLIRTVVATLHPAAERKRIDIAVAVPIGLPHALCDSGKLYHAVANLVQNAITYTETGGVTVSAASDGRHLTVKVADSGIGLSEDERRHVLELLEGGLRFVRFDANGGSGLGLFIVKSIVEAHGGTIAIESPGKGHGSTFGFRIPLT